MCLACLICTSQQRPLTSGVRLIAMSLLTPPRGKGSCTGYSNLQAGHAVRSQLIQRSPRLAKRSTRNASRDCGGLSRFVSSEVPPRSVAHSQSVPSIRQRPKLEIRMHYIFFADRKPPSISTLDPKSQQLRTCYFLQARIVHQHSTSQPPASSTTIYIHHKAAAQAQTLQLVSPKCHRTCAIRPPIRCRIYHLGTPTPRNRPCTPRRE